MRHIRNRVVDCVHDRTPINGKYRYPLVKGSKKRMARITVILPAYNVEKRLDECLRSIQGQTMGDWDAVACDDASSDDTWKILRAWAEKDARFTVLRNEENRSAAATRNRCLENADGEYIALQDADDYSAPDRFAKQLRFLEENRKYDFVGCVMACFDENGVWQKIIRKKKPGRRDFLWGLPFNHAAVLFRKEALEAVGGYRVAQETVRVEDLDLFMRLYAAGSRGYNLRDTLYYYNEDKDAFSRRKYRYRIDEAKIRLQGFRSMGLMPWGIVGVLKPLIVGLIPGRLMKRLKRLFYVFRKRTKRVKKSPA
jgi:glycosyltransferase involved in cell wall biosynthesis